MLSSSRFRARAVSVLPGLGRGDLQHLAGHGLGEAIDAGDPVLYLQDLPHFLGMEILLVVLDLGKEDVLDFTGSKLGHVGHFLFGPQKVWFRPRERSRSSHR